MDPLIIIPTFTTARAGRPGTSVATTYDHPTPVGKVGLLPRLLKSLVDVRDVGTIAVLAASESSIEVRAMEAVVAACSKFPSLDIVVVGASERALVSQRMEQLNLGRFNTEIGLEGYAAVRNLGLVVACVLGFDSVVFLDEDEVVDDPDFLAKGMYGLGKLTKRGIPILAKTGYYLNSDGTYHAKGTKRWYNRYWPQAEAFNAWIDTAMSGPRLSRSNHVCGGCLALHREAFKRLAFDPWVVRGEDLDYLLNLRMYGADMWFDNRWSLSHLPPQGISEGLRFRQDAYRWLYEYRKMEFSRTQIDLQQVKPASLQPYPGPFLQPGIEKNLKRTAQLRSIALADKAAYRKVVQAVDNEAAAYAQRNCAKYFEFQYVWPQIMQRMDCEPVLAEVLWQSLERTRAKAQSSRPAARTAVSSPDAQGSSARPGTQAGGRASRDGRDVQGQRALRRRPGIDPGATGDIQMNVAD